MAQCSLVDFFVLLFGGKKRVQVAREKSRLSLSLFSPRAVNIVRQFPVKRRFEYELG